MAFSFSFPFHSPSFSRPSSSRAGPRSASAGPAIPSPPPATRPVRREMATQKALTPSPLAVDGPALARQPDRKMAEGRAEPQRPTANRNGPRHGGSRITAHHSASVTLAAGNCCLAVCEHLQPYLYIWVVCADTYTQSATFLIYDSTIPRFHDSTNTYQQTTHAGIHKPGFPCSVPASPESNNPLLVPALLDGYMYAACEIRTGRQRWAHRTYSATSKLHRSSVSCTWAGRSILDFVAWVHMECLFLAVMTYAYQKPRPPAQSTPSFWKRNIITSFLRYGQPSFWVGE